MKLKAILGFLVAVGIAPMALAETSSTKVEEKKHYSSQWRAQEGWTLADESKHIKVYTKAVPGSDLKAFKGVMDVTSKLSTLVAVLDDTTAGPEWLHDIRVVKKVKVLGPKHGINYSVNGAPFPVTDRDMYFESKVDQDPKSLRVRIQLTGLPHYQPKDDRYVRMQALDGDWIFEPLDPGKVRVIYQVHADPGGSLPSWLVNSLVVDTPKYTLQNLRKMIQKEKYQNVNFSWLNEAGSPHHVSDLP